MLVNFNGEIIKYSELPYISAFSKGCFVFQQFLNINKKFIFFEEAYFNLMASMRKLRINIPINWSPEFIFNQLIKLSDNKSLKIYIYNDKETKFLILSDLEETTNILNTKSFVIDVYKNIEIYNTFLSGINTIHIENIPAKIFARENELDDVIFLNSNKKIARTINGNLFLIKDNQILFNGENEGAYKNTITNYFLNFIIKQKEWTLVKKPLNIFDTQNVDEIFILSEYFGIIPINQIRKKTFKKEKIITISKELESTF